jgi:hypothetical protein
MSVILSGAAIACAANRAGNWQKESPSDRSRTGDQRMAANITVRCDTNYTTEGVDIFVVNIITDK